MKKELTKDNLPKANRQITAPKVRVIDEEGNMIGVMLLKDALKRAYYSKLDLIEVSPNADPPVCKILDLGKFKYALQKKAQETKKKQKVVVLKEIKLRPNIGHNDLNRKIRDIKHFISEGNKVKVSLSFKGRENLYTESGQEVFDHIISELSDYVKMELPAKRVGNQLVMVLAPNSVEGGSQ